MTDLEMTRLAAEAMGMALLYINGALQQASSDSLYLSDKDGQGWQRVYQPLHDDAQAMQLVKKLRLSIGALRGTGTWSVVGTYPADAEHSDLNRAIVECVAKMQGANHV
jgi:hypothetical protein